MFAFNIFWIIFGVLLVISLYTYSANKKNERLMEQQIAEERMQRIKAQNRSESARTQRIESGVCHEVDEMCMRALMLNKSKEVQKYVDQMDSFIRRNANTLRKPRLDYCYVQLTRVRKHKQSLIRQEQIEDEERAEKISGKELTDHQKFILEQRRLMTASLRYKIMERDGFRCVICGATSADGAKLHVDHIFPVSKGGKTEPDNLRTLCDYCNLGKGDKIEEAK